MSWTTWNSNNKGNNVVLSNNNLTAQINSNNSVIALYGKNNGKWYWEVEIKSVPSSGHCRIGVINGSTNLNITLYQVAGGIFYSDARTLLKYDGSTTANYFNSTFTINDIIGIGLDFDSKNITFYKNGIIQGIIGFATSDTLFPACNQGGSSGLVVANFGATPFKYEVPDGYLPYVYGNRVYYFVKTNNKIKTLSNGEWIEITDELNNSLFEMYGIKNLQASKLNEIVKPYSILAWTDNTNATKMTLDYLYNQYKTKLLEINTDPFSPLNILNQQEEFEVLTYSDEYIIKSDKSQGTEEIVSEGKLFKVILNDFISVTEAEII